MISITQKSDTLGAFASGLCLVHCLITPVLFIVQTCTNVCCANGDVVPSWWTALDYIFLGVSLLAIFWSVKTTSKNWIKYALWISWGLLFFVIMNERFALMTINKYLGYVPALLLVSLHLYNRRYCQCNEDKCCTAKN